METEDMELNYSKQDLELLVSEAERLVMTKCNDHHHHHHDNEREWSSDSDYETRASREWLVRSEPNISHQRPVVTSSPGSAEAKRRPRRSVASRPRDWRHSLPECLEYYQPPELTSDDGGRVSVASLPLSDLWEHEAMADTETEENTDNEKALETNLTSFGEDYSKYLYSETETSSDSDIFSDESDVNNLRLSRHGVQTHKTQKSQTALKQLLIKTNPSHDSWKCEKELEKAEEVCRKNILMLSDETKEQEDRHQIRSIKRLIGKWKCLQNKTQTRLHQLQELRHISDGIRGVRDDLETLGSILDDEDNEDDLEDDYELVHMRHQLHEQVKSHLLEVSDSLFQLNLGLHSLRSSLQSPEAAEMEAELGQVYRQWQLVHSSLARAEVRLQRSEMQRQQGEFSCQLSQRLSQLASEDQEDDDSDDHHQMSPVSGGWWRSVIKAGLVTSLLLASVVSGGLLWSQARCQHSYYSSVWPLLSYSAIGPRPY